MDPDGKSLITSVGSRDSTVWIHDQNGDRQIASEGNSQQPAFSSEGDTLYFLMANGQTKGYELWAEDLKKGAVERLLPGYTMKSYSVSQDGKEVAFAANDENGVTSLWIASTNRRSSPVHIVSTSTQDSPHFLPDGDLVFLAVEGGSNFCYRMKADGGDRRKIIPDPVLDVRAVSPDGRWIVASAPDAKLEHKAAVKVFAIDGSQSLNLCIGYCLLGWDTSGKFMFFSFPGLFEGSYALPVQHDFGLPKLPEAGITRKEDLADPKSNVAVPWFVDSALSPSVYAYTRQNTRRNLYRIPLP